MKIPSSTKASMSIEYIQINTCPFPYDSEYHPRDPHISQRCSGSSTWGMILLASLLPLVKHMQKLSY